MTPTAIVACEALVLRNLRHGETSRIATLFTRELGKVGVIAKGARLPASPFGASLELFNRGSFQLYYRPGRDLQFLKSGALEREYRGILRDPRRYRLASALAEFLDRVLTGEEPAGELFDFARRAFEILETAPPATLPELFRGLQLRIASLLGYAPRLDRCAACGRDVPPAEPSVTAASEDPGGPAVPDRWLFLPAEGGVVCGACLPRFDPGGTGIQLTSRALRRVRAMAIGPARFGPSREAEPAGQVRDTAVAPAWLRTVDRLVEEYLRYHLEAYRGLRSLASPAGG